MLGSEKVQGVFDSMSSSAHNRNGTMINSEVSSFEQQSNTQSVLHDGCSIRGAFECVGDLRLDGFIEGDVVVDGTITIGESALIRANVRARSAVVFGRVVGDIICADRIELHVGAQVRGNIKTRKLVIQDGVIFDGRCEMAQDKSDVKNSDISQGSDT